MAGQQTGAVAAVVGKPPVQSVPASGLAPADMVLVHLLQCGADIESGVLLSDGGRVYDVDLRHNGMRAGTESAVRVERWLDITDCWQTTPFSSQIADAFI
ncbi:hypothetical protein [Streptomyces sp. NPDC101115]|uniref:hypothetical protein n=1 Tax=Streptomyces sp. NPDC101115 TaxID=3366106 RepID=UPI0037F49F48